MNELEELRKLVGPDAVDWNRAQLEQLDRDMETVAALLLEVYRSRKQHHRPVAYTWNFDSPNVDG